MDRTRYRGLPTSRYMPNRVKPKRAFLGPICRVERLAKNRFIRFPKGTGVVEDAHMPVSRMMRNRILRSMRATHGAANS